MITTVKDNIENNANLNEIEDIRIGGIFKNDIYNKYDKESSYTKKVHDNLNFFKYFFITTSVIIVCIMVIILKRG